MNLEEAHQYLGQLLLTGVDPKTPLVALSDGWPCEIAGAFLLDGDYNGDPAPQLTAHRKRTGKVLALLQIGEDPCDLLNGGTHTKSEPDVPFPWK